MKYGSPYTSIYNFPYYRKYLHYTPAYNDRHYYYNPYPFAFYSSYSPYIYRIPYSRSLDEIPPPFYPPPENNVTTIRETIYETPIKKTVVYDSPDRVREAATATRFEQLY